MNSIFLTYPTYPLMEILIISEMPKKLHTEQNIFKKEEKSKGREALGFACLGCAGPEEGPGGLCGTNTVHSLLLLSTEQSVRVGAQIFLQCCKSFGH